MNFHVGRNDEAFDLIERYHYSGRVPSNVQVTVTAHEDGGLFGDFGPEMAACVFSIPPTRWSEPVLELSRLVRRDDVSMPLSSLISFACKFIRSHGKGDLLVSFADWTHNHHGGIYQSCSWSFAGKRQPTEDGLVIDGNFYPGRSCNSIFGTRSKDKLEKQLQTKFIERHHDAGKYLYFRPLNNFGRKKAERLGLESLPYPKPSTRGATG